VTSPSLAELAGRAGGLKAQRPADDPERIEAEQEHRTAQLEAHLQEVLGRAPRLTEQQLDRLVAIIRSGR
jgi:hypothetical protein